MRVAKTVLIVSLLAMITIGYLGALWLLSIGQPRG